MARWSNARIAIVVCVILNALSECLKIFVRSKASRAMETGAGGVDLGDISVRVSARAGEGGAESVRERGDGALMDSATGDARVVARRRECGSPAVDGYAKVNLTCLAMSVTAREFDASTTGRERLVVHAEEHASYDGVAVRWGIHHTTQTAAECAKRCREHVVKPNGTGAEVLPCNVFVWCPIDVERCFGKFSRLSRLIDFDIFFVQRLTRTSISRETVGSNLARHRRMWR